MTRNETDYQFFVRKNKLYLDRLVEKGLLVKKGNDYELGDTAKKNIRKTVRSRGVPVRGRNVTKALSYGATLAYFGQYEGDGTPELPLSKRDKKLIGVFQDWVLKSDEWEKNLK